MFGRCLLVLGFPGRGTQQVSALALLAVAGVILKEQPSCYLCVWVGTRCRFAEATAL